jgi:hypothetical protein
MCQNWYSVIGQVLDVVGFLLIASEWHMMFRRDMRERMLRADEFFEKESAEILGTKFAEPTDVLLTLLKEFRDLTVNEEVVRTRRFYPGVFLVILGFIFQVLGSWPHLLPSCH